MPPRTITHDGRELGNIEAVVAITGDAPVSYKYYARAKRPLSNPAPDFVIYDEETGERMYDLDDVQDWQDRRNGPGNPGAMGVAQCGVCKRDRIPVTHRRTFYKHRIGRSKNDPICDGSGDPVPEPDGSAPAAVSA